LKAKFKPPIDKLFGSKKEADLSEIHKDLQQLHALFIKNTAN